MSLAGARLLWRSFGCNRMRYRANSAYLSNTSKRENNMKEKSGYIYIFTNPSFPDYVKIGFATDVEKRLSQLNSSSAIPFAFRVYATYAVTSRLTDKSLHKLIDDLNPDLHTIEEYKGKTRVREFFAMTPEAAYELLEAIAKISGTESNLKRWKPTKEEAEDEKVAKAVSRRRPPFKFSMVGINTGEEVVFTKDKKVIATVVDDKHVEYDGQTMSLSALAELLFADGVSRQGPAYFTYKGEILSEIRDRVEND